MNTVAPTIPLPPEGMEEHSTETRDPKRSRTPRPPSHAEGIDGFAPLLFAPAFYGPAAIFVMGPWLLLVILLIGPAALLITFVLFVLVAAGLLSGVAALLASPYLLLRHLRAQHPAWPRRVPAVARRAPVPSPQASRAPSLQSPHISLVSHDGA